MVRLIMEITYFHPDIKSFISSFDGETASDVLDAIDFLSIKEYQLCMPYSKKIERDLYELRILGHHNIRVFYTFYEGRIILLHIIEKKTQKLKLQDLATARRRLRYLHS